LPLFDRRVIEFAASRPRWERCSGAETKHLLRHAMRGLLPDHVLASRPTRTGTTRTYFAAAMRANWDALLSAMLESSVLAELGILNPALMRRASAQYARGERDIAIDLFLTLQVELWLRTRLRPAEGQAERTPDAVWVSDAAYIPAAS
jgi:hypothetical protein